MTGKSSKRSRLEDEVLEILAKADRSSTPSERAKSHLRVVKAKRRGLSLQRLAPFDHPWGWFGLALVILLVGGALTADGELAWQLVLYAGMAAFVVGVIRLFRPSASNRTRKMWRGRQIDMSRPGFEMRDRFDDWRKRR